MAYYRSSAVDALADQFGGMVVVVTLFVLAVGVWALVQAGNLVLRVLARYPEEKAPWVALAMSGVAWTVATVGALAAPHAAISQGLLGIALLATLGLVLVCQYVHLRHDDLFQEEPRPGLLLEKVLRRPWLHPLT